MISVRPTIKMVPKIWGHELWLVNHDKYCGKILYFRAGKSGSLHFHKIKNETFYLKSGIVTVEVDNHTYQLSPGELIDIPSWAAHRVTAVADSEIFEFSTHHDDTDTYRIELSA